MKRIIRGGMWVELRTVYQKFYFSEPRRYGSTSEKFDSLSLSPRYRRSFLEIIGNNGLFGMNITPFIDWSEKIEVNAFIEPISDLYELTFSFEAFQYLDRKEIEKDDHFVVELDKIAINFLFQHLTECFHEAGGESIKQKCPSISWIRIKTKPLISKIKYGLMRQNYNVEEEREDIPGIIDRLEITFPAHLSRNLIKNYELRRHQATKVFD